MQKKGGRWALTFLILTANPVMVGVDKWGGKAWRTPRESLLMLSDCKSKHLDRTHALSWLRRSQIVYGKLVPIPLFSLITPKL